MKNSKVTIAYYLCILTVLVSQALFTVYQGSIVIGDGQRITQLERQRAELVEKNRSLKQSLAADSSLLHISQGTLYNEFVPVQDPIVITNLNTVASR